MSEPKAILCVVVFQGAISGVYADRPEALDGIRVLIMDHDNDGVDEENLTPYRLNDGTEDTAAIWEEPVASTDMDLPELARRVDEI